MAPYSGLPAGAAQLLHHICFPFVCSNSLPLLREKIHERELLEEQVAHLRAELAAANEAILHSIAEVLEERAMAEEKRGVKWLPFDQRPCSQLEAVSCCFLLALCSVCSVLLLPSANLALRAAWGSADLSQVCTVAPETGVLPESLLDLSESADQKVWCLFQQVLPLVD